MPMRTMQYPHLDSNVGLSSLQVTDHLDMKRFIIYLIKIIKNKYIDDDGNFVEIWHNVAHL